MDKIEIHLQAQLSGLNLNASRDCQFNCTLSPVNKIISATTIVYLLCYNAALMSEAKKTALSYTALRPLNPEQQRWDSLLPNRSQPMAGLS